MKSASVQIEFVVKTVGLSDPNILYLKQLEVMYALKAAKMSIVTNKYAAKDNKGITFRHQRLDCGLAVCCRIADIFGARGIDIGKPAFEGCYDISGVVDGKGGLGDV